jgi:hypothetical protein
MTKYLFLLFLSVALFACDQDDDDGGPTSNNDQDTVSEFLLHDDGLIISLLTDDEDDETDYFDSYVFFFNENGSVMATDGNQTVEGSYNVFTDDGRVELEMDFPDIQNFDELNDDWYFISIDQNTIRFDDDGDTLEFQQL